MKQKWIEYILMLAESANFKNKVNEDDLDSLPIDELITIADKLEELYKMKQKSEAMDVILAEVNKHGAYWVRGKYGILGEEVNK